MIENSEVLKNLKTAISAASDRQIIQLAAGRLEVFIDGVSGEVFLDEPENSSPGCYKLQSIGIVVLADEDLYHKNAEELEMDEVLARANEIRAQILLEDFEQAVEITLDCIESREEHEEIAQ